MKKANENRVGVGALRNGSLFIYFLINYSCFKTRNVAQTH